MNISNELLLVAQGVILVIAFFLRRTLNEIERAQAEFRTGQEKILFQVTATNGRVIKLESEAEAHEVLDHERFSDLKNGVNTIQMQHRERHVDLERRLDRLDVGKQRYDELNKRLDRWEKEK